MNYRLFGMHGRTSCRLPSRNVRFPKDWHIDPVQNVRENIHFGPDQPYIEDEKGSVPVFPNASESLLQDLVLDRYFFDRLIDRYRYMDR